MRSQTGPQSYGVQPDTGILRIHQQDRTDAKAFSEVERQTNARGVGGGGRLKEAIRYLQGLPLHKEGMAQGFAFKYGEPALKRVLQALPNLNPDALMELDGNVEQANIEHDAMRDRDRQKADATRGMQTETSYPPASLMDLLGQQPR